MSTSLVSVKARFDRVNYTVPAAGRAGELGERAHRRAVRGDVIRIEAEEAARLRDLGAVVDVDVPVPPPVADPFSVGQNPPGEAAIAAGLTRAEVVGGDATGRGAQVVAIDRPGPNASNREAVMAQARQRVEDMARAGHLGEGFTLVGPDGQVAAFDGSEPPGSTGPALPTVEELAALNVGDVLAYLTQHPEDVDKVDDSNKRRAKSSTQIAGAVEKVREVQAELTDEAAHRDRSTPADSPPHGNTDTATSSGVEQPVT